MLSSVGRKFKRLFYIGMMNVLVFTALFILMEISYRVRHDGVSAAFMNLAHSMDDVPYSNLGTANWVIHDETLGYRLNPQKSGVNSLSIRDDEVVIPKPHGLYRIVYLGDSIPYDKRGFVSYTKEKFGREGNFEVINAGIPGYTAYQELLFFKTYLLRTDPDLVIWTYCLNDNHKFLHRFDENARMLLTDEALESLKVTSLYDKIVSHSYVLSELKLRIVARQKQRQECRFPWECVPDFHIAWEDEPWAQYEEYLQEMKRLTERVHSKLVIVVFPYEPQLEQVERNPHFVLKPQRRLGELCEKYDVPCLDLFPEFNEERKKSVKLFRDGIHLNEEGHKLTASLIYSFLHKNSLLPP